MKSYILVLFVALFAIAACKKTETAQDEIAIPVFTKTFVVNDGNGNSATVEISGAIEDQINSLGSQHFDLFVTTVQPQNTTSPASTAEPKKVGFERWNQENTLVIDVKDYSFQKGITGFRVELKPEFKNPIERDRWTEFTEFGSNGVRGAFAHYETESCSGEELDVDLDKKQACSNWFWQDLSSGYLGAPGDEWSSFTSSVFCKYRFRYDFEDDCSSNHSIIWWWWTI